MNVLVEREGQILAGKSLVSGLDKDVIKELIRDKIGSDPPADFKLSCYPEFRLDI